MGFFIILKIHHLNFKKEIKIALEDGFYSHQLMEMKLDSGLLKNLIWLESDEFSLEGELYDVICTEKDKQGNVKYYCIKDHKEKEILMTYMDHGAVHHPSGIQKIRVNIQDTFLTYYFELTNLQIKKWMINASSDFLYLNKISSLQIDLNYPPPKLV